MAERDPRAAPTAAPEIPEHYLGCRDYGHAWAPMTAQWRAAERAYYVQLRCQRCGTVRARLVDRNGHLVANHYTYAEGYLVKGIGRMTGVQRDAIRIASIEQLLARKRESAE